jgi:WXG100 family type VII secretion target
MANINVTFQQMEDASQTMSREASDMQNKLSQLRMMVENLVQDGYVTDKSSKAFDEAYKELNKGGEQVMEGLTGIADYLKQAAEALRRTDEELANAITK